MGGKPKYKIIQTTDAPLWDAYVHAHPHGTLYHLYGWRNVVEKTYGHQTYYLAAIKESDSQYSVPSTQYPIPNTQYPIPSSQYPIPNPHLVGLLPLVHLRSLLFGNSLISMPYVDLGGILADDDEIGEALVKRATKIGQNLGADTVELRHAQPRPFLNTYKAINSKFGFTLVTKSPKVRMLLDLPDSPETLMKSFNSKFRNKIKKPTREGLVAKIGGLELLEDFYRVFAVNMRDLGSPVHSIKLIRQVLMEFLNHAKLFIVYRGKQPMACSLTLPFKGTLENPWASSLREYRFLRANTLLYWTMLEYACSNGLTQFDFGRSTPGGGSYKFKEQWGAMPRALHWHYILLNGRRIDNRMSETSRFSSLIDCWKKLPVPITTLMGPMIRKHIGL